MHDSQETRHLNNHPQQGHRVNGRAGSPQRVSIRKLRLDGGTQARAALDPVAIEDYKRRWIEGGDFPPVIAFDDGADLWVADGFHRIQAAKAANLEQIEVEVRKGGQADAIWYSVAANQSHGLRRSPGDKQRAIRMALMHPNSTNMSDRGIADHVGCSDKTVAAVRRGTLELPQSEIRVGRDGRAIKVGNIGARKRCRAEATPTGDATPSGQRSGARRAASDKFALLSRQIDNAPDEQLKMLVESFSRRLARSGMALNVVSIPQVTLSRQLSPTGC